MMKNNICHAVIISAIGIAVTSGCASAPAPEVKAPAAVVEKPAPKPAPAVKPAEPAVPPEITALREAVKSGDAAAVESKARAIIDADPQGEGAPEALRALAATSIEQNKLPEALLYAETAQKAAPDDVETLMLSARILNRLERNDDAVKLLKRASEIQPDQPEPYIMRAAILLEFLDTARALEAAAKAHELAPDSCDAKIVYADALYAENKYKEAVQAYESADSCEKSESVIKNMARLYEVHVPDSKKSCALYKILAEKHPDNDYYKASRDYQCSL